MNPYASPASQKNIRDAEVAAREAALKSFGISAGDARRYSLSKAIASLMENKPVTGREAEVDQEVRRKFGREHSSNNSFFMASNLPFGQSRAMTAGTAANGGYLVATDQLAESFVDLLRNRTVVAELGAQFLTGLQGNVTIPKLTAGSTAYWLTNEETEITESQPTLGQLSLTPKNVGALTTVSRQLMLQSSPTIDSLVAADLAKSVALAIDLAALEGDGTGGAPTGIANTSGIGSVTGTSLAYAGILEFFTDLAAANAAMVRPGFATTSAVAALLVQRQKFANTYSPLWEGSVREGTIAGIRAMSSGQMAAGTMIAADWNELVIGEWGVIEIALDPFSGFRSGLTSIRAIATVDVGVRHAGAFSRATSIT